MRLLGPLAVWSLTGLGIWRLYRRYPGKTVTSTVLAGLSLVLSAIVSTVDMRYMLPFVPLIYLAQAAGLTWIVRRLLAGGPGVEGPR